MRWNIPNALTVLRLVLVLPVGLLLFVEGDAARWAALGLFLFASVTDWLDGWLARRLDQGSAFGRCFDPIADKVLVGVILLLLAPEMAAWALPAGAIVIARELIVSGLRETIGEAGGSLPVTRLAKWKAASQMAVLVLLLVPGFAAGLPGGLLLWLAAILSAITGWGYYQAARPHLAPKVVQP